VCVCFLLYLSVYSLSICVARSVCFEFCCMFKTNFFQFQNLHLYPTAVHTPLLIFLYFSSTCICIVSILVCVYPHTYTNLPPSSRRITFASEYAYMSSYIFLPFGKHLAFLLNIHMSPHSDVNMLQLSDTCHF